MIQVFSKWAKSIFTNSCNFFIVTVPTPIDRFKRPVLTPLIKTSETIDLYFKTGDVILYESTIYPGVTEEESVPILEKVSEFVFYKDFFLGYSQERIKPGEKQQMVNKI